MKISKDESKKMMNIYYDIHRHRCFTTLNVLFYIDLKNEVRVLAHHTMPFVLNTGIVKTLDGYSHGL